MPELYRRFVGGLGDAVLTDLATVPMTSKPLDLVCRPPLPRNVRLYVFNCTDHPSERKAGDYRIQLRLPGQQRRQRGQLALDSGFLVLLVGYVAEFNVFVLWDANAHSDFSYSKGIQVGALTVHQAAIHGYGEQRRGVRGSGGYPEQVLAVRTDRLLEGLQRREELTKQALLGASAPPAAT